MLRLNHKNLDVWKLSLKFIKGIYELTEKFPKSEVYGLVSQMRRAAVSVASNLAEGSSRKTVPERKRFYEISRSSLVEIDTQIEIALELEIINETGIEQISEKLNHIFAMLTNLIIKTKWCGVYVNLSRLTFHISH